MYVTEIPSSEMNKIMFTSWCGSQSHTILGVSVSKTVYTPNS